MTEAGQARSTGLAKAWALLEASRPEQALAQLAELSPDEANRTTAFRLRGIALIQLQRWTEVDSNARNGLAAGGPDPVLLGQLGSALSERGEYRNAEQALLDALALAPLDADLLCDYARLCLNAGQTDKAKRLWERAAAQDPHTRSVLAVRVLIAIAEADDREAQRAGNDFLAAYPADPVALALQGQVTQMRGRSGYDSIRQAAAAAPADPDYADMAWEARVYTHPLLIPLRPIFRLGTVKTWLIAVGVIFGLRAVGLAPLSLIATVAWLALCVYSWVVPPLVRKWVLRKRI